MGNILSLAGFAHAVTLDGLGEDDRRLTHMFGRRRIRSIHFVRIVAAAIQAPDVVVGHVGDECRELGIFAEEMLAHVRAVLRFHGLVFAVDAFFHAF